MAGNRSLARRDTIARRGRIEKIATKVSRREEVNLRLKIGPHFRALDAPHCTFWLLLIVRDLAAEIARGANLLHLRGHAASHSPCCPCRIYFFVWRPMVRAAMRGVD